MSNAIRSLRSLGLFVAALLAVAAADAPSPAPAIPAQVRAAVDAPDRSDADRALDAGRRPAEVLAFLGIRSGDRVAELGAGGGYTTELLARAVGPTGRVWGQNSAFVLERFAEKPWSERLAKPALANVVRLDRPFDDPFPASLVDLDAVLIVLFYHDTVWQKVDRARMNEAVFRVLRPGGVYGVIDHAAAPGHGTDDVETLHRIEEPVVVSEVEAAGFRLASSAAFLRNPDDAHDWNDSPRSAAERRGTSDRFVLKFEKPAPPCNRLIFPQLRAALHEVVDRGLADEIHPGEYAGCYYPRFIAGTTTLSNHSFGLALDLNVPGNQRGTVGEMDRTWCRSSRSGASPGAATGTTPTRCTSSSSEVNPR